ncbi:hypothetical protein SMIR_22195 [Streptomyces mirabilis]|nr:hypothetical protein SMIR_22195 [Streptomyces mirabilis]
MTSRAASASSAITGTWSGPRTSGRTTGEDRPGRPNRMGWAAHRAVERLWVMTINTGSQRYFSWRYER